MSEAFEELVASLDYPMFIVTTAVDDHRSGCLVGFTTQASISPQRLLVMLSKKNHTYRLAQQASTLVVHFLGTDNHHLAAVFGEETGDETDKFERCAWSAGPGGVPILDDVKGAVVGEVVERFDAGDHVGHLIEPSHVFKGKRNPTLTFQMVKDMKPGHDA